MLSKMSAITYQRIMRRFSVCFLVLSVLYFADCAHGILTSESSTLVIQEKIKSNEFLVVIFCDEGVTQEECVQDTGDVVKLFNNEVKGFPGIEAVLTSDMQSADMYGVLDFPTIAFFRSGTPIFYSEEDSDSYDVGDWMSVHRSTEANTLTDGNFEHDTQASTGATTGNWFIMFYDQECSDYLASWERVAMSLKQQTVVGKVDTAANPGLRQRFADFTDCPSFVVFSQGQMYELDEEDLDFRAIVTFGRNGFKEQKGIPVPGPVSASIFSAAFSAVVGMATGGSTAGMCMVVSGGTLAVLLVVLVILSKKRKRRAKFD